MDQTSIGFVMEVVMAKTLAYDPNGCVPAVFYNSSKTIYGFSFHTKSALVAPQDSWEKQYFGESRVFWENKCNLIRCLDDIVT